MSRLLGTTMLRVSQPGPRSAFARDPDTGQFFYRYLTINGERAFNIGFSCGTCQFLFERLGGANMPSLAPQEVAERLGRGLDALDPALLDTVAHVLPQGDYRVSLQVIRPLKATLGSTRDYFSNEQVQLWGVDPFWGLPHWPKVEYYRSLTRAFGQDQGLFEFVIPMYAPSWLNDDALAHYQERIAAGEQPTAMALSVLDIKQPADWEDPQPVTKHWCLAHYLIDGHHKTHAASIWHRPITLISFLAVGECLAGEAEIDELFQLLGSA